MRRLDSPDRSSPRAVKTAGASVARWWSNLRLFGKVAVVLITIAVLAAVLAATLGEGGTNKQEAALAAFCTDEQLLQTSFRIQAMSQLASRLPGGQRQDGSGRQRSARLHVWLTWAKLREASSDSNRKQKRDTCSAAAPLTAPTQ